MKITRDILQALQIETIYLLCKDTLYLCAPLEINHDSWIISADSNIQSREGTLKIKYCGSFLLIPVTISEAKDDDIYAFTYDIIMKKNVVYENPQIALFFEQLAKLETKDSEWKNRKEERYPIGIDEEKCRLINFSSVEQLIISDKVQLPCAINNLSFSGARITTVEGNFVKEKRVCLHLSFRNPIEQISLISTIKNCLIRTLDHDVISVLSLEFCEAPLAYKERLEGYIKQLAQHELPGQRA